MMSTTLGDALERRRLELRVGRVAAVIAALYVRADDHRRELGRVPVQLDRAIRDFEAEVRWMRNRLTHLDHHPHEPETSS